MVLTISTAAALWVLPVAYLLPPDDVGLADSNMLQPIIGFLVVSNARLGAHAGYAYTLTDQIELFVEGEVTWSRKSREIHGRGRVGLRVRF